MRKRGKVLLGVALVMLAIAVVVGRCTWKQLTGPGAEFKEASRILQVPTGADFQAVMDSLTGMEAIGDESKFRWLAEQKNYIDHVKPGRYRVTQGMSMNDLVNMLRSGEQEPVKVTFTNVDHLPELAGRVARALEADSVAFLQTLLDPDRHREVGLTKETFISLFIPNTYEFWWTTTPAGFIERMRLEHDSFWNAERKALAREHGLSEVEIATLASIVQAETVQMTDAPRIAGVYLNRLRIGMPLQADPTLKFALGLDSVNRVLDRDKEVDSPYNTYRNKGLPPGPINMPEPRFIDAVLNAEKHDYLYFCARADLSGYSDFTRSYEQHLVNARRYQRALNERKIFR